MQNNQNLKQGALSSAQPNNHLISTHPPLTNQLHPSHSFTFSHTPYPQLLHNDAQRRLDYITSQEFVQQNPNNEEHKEGNPIIQSGISSLLASHHPLVKTSPLQHQQERTGIEQNNLTHAIDDYFDHNQLHYEASFYDDYNQDINHNTGNPGSSQQASPSPYNNIYINHNSYQPTTESQEQVIVNLNSQNDQPEINNSQDNNEDGEDHEIENQDEEEDRNYDENSESDSQSMDDITYNNESREEVKESNMHSGRQNQDNSASLQQTQENRIELLLNEMRSDVSGEQSPRLQQQFSVQEPQPRISQQNIIDYFQTREGASTDQLIEEFMIYFQYLIRQERNSLKEEKLRISQDKLDFLKERKQQQEELEKDKRIWQDNKSRVESMYQPEGNIIDLDIGGTHKITTTRSTLCMAKDSTLAAMFSGRHKLPEHNGRVFVDRDGETFVTVINYLRNGKLPIFDNKIKENAFYEELDYWQIPLNLHCGQNDSNENQAFDPTWCAPTLELSQNRKLLKKNDQQHGIVFCSQPLDIFNPYIEFKVKIEAVFKGKSHLFVGLVDKNKYRPEFLTSTFWRDAPSSMYWDVWNTKLIKTDDKGHQIGGVFGYGCQCEDNSSRIGILYDAKNRAVSFYKNGICQGVAFTNVMSGFYPSLDVWFQQGEIEILPEKGPTQKEFLQINRLN